MIGVSIISVFSGRGAVVSMNIDELGDVMVYLGGGRFQLSEATRFEIYPEKGSVRHVLTLEAGAVLCLQDGGRTVKVFTKEEAELKEWREANPLWG